MKAWATLPLPDRPAIAVLPFVNMSDDPERDFSDGISEDLITALSKLRWFFVIARDSSFAFKGEAVHIKQVGEELGVGYVIEGSCVRMATVCASRLSSTTSQPEATSGRSVTIDGSLTCSRCRTRSPRRSSPRSTQLYATENFHCQRNAPESLDAWGLVMRALSHFWRVTRQDNIVAQALLEKAITIDPNYGQALGILASSHAMCAYNGWADMATAVSVAERAAMAATRADGDDPWAHYALGCVHLLLRRFDDLLAEFELALNLNPNFALAQSVYGLALAFSGRWEDAHAATARALRLSPRDPFSTMYYGIAAYANFVGGKYEEAMRLASISIRLRGDHVGGHRGLTISAAMAGKTDIATAALQELLRAQPNFSLAWIAANMPFKHDADRERYMEAFRRAGLK